MKLYFCANEAIFERKHKAHFVVALWSSLKRWGMDVNLINDGDINDELRWFQDQGLVVIRHESSLKADMFRVGGFPGFDPIIASGAYLRCDIPILEASEDFVLYCDCDVMFQRAPILDAVRPEFFACSSEMRFDYWGGRSIPV